MKELEGEGSTLWLYLTPSIVSTGAGCARSDLMGPFDASV